MEAQPASFGLGAIGQIAITASDVDRAIAFYRDSLGMKLLFQVPGMGFFDCSGIRLMLSKAERPQESYSSILYFRVADNAQELAHLADAELLPMPSVWGHRAGNPAANPRDAEFLKKAVRRWLE